MMTTVMIMRGDDDDDGDGNLAIIFSVWLFWQFFGPPP